jgi:serine/threonine-protein kinase
MGTEKGLQPGDVIGGKYRVERILGVGGMGLVVAATHLALGQLVAIKVMLPEVARDPAAIERFLREARAAGRLRSEHAVEIKDVGQGAGGEPFIVMEYLDGSDLAHVLAKRRTLYAREAVGYVLEACVGLAEAHARGIVHRDLKPANMFLTRRPDGRSLIKLLDFGISKLTDGPEGGLTKTQVVMGSAEYMSPEQMRSARSADVRSDVWSLGVVLFELVTGRVPFGGESFAEVCAAVARDPVPPLGVRGLDEVVRRCLEKEPARRYQTIAELADALGPFGSLSTGELVARVHGTLDGSGTAIPLPLTPAPEGAPAATDATTLEVSSGQSVTRRRLRGRGALVAAGATLGAVALTLGAVELWARRAPVPDLASDGASLGSSAAAPAGEPAHTPPDARPRAGSTTEAIERPPAPQPQAGGRAPSPTVSPVPAPTVIHLAPPRPSPHVRRRGPTKPSDPYDVRK